MGKVIYLAEYRAKKSQQVRDMEDAYRSFYKPVVEKEKQVVKFTVIEQVSREEAMAELGKGSQDLFKRLVRELEEEGVDTTGISIIEPDPDCPY